MRSKFLKSAAIGVSVVSMVVAASAAAEVVTETVFVDAASYPWDRSANPDMRFGLNDGKRPKVVAAKWRLAGLKVRFKAEGTMFIQTESGTSGPDGVQLLYRYGLEARTPWDYVSNGKGAPMFGALVGAFINAEGEVVGRPFVIGREYEVVAPEGAIAISLGTTDDRYRDNTGGYTVSISIPKPEVIVEPS